MEPKSISEGFDKLRIETKRHKWSFEFVALLLFNEMNLQPVEVIPYSPLCLLSADLLKIACYFLQDSVRHILGSHKFLKLFAALMNGEENPHKNNSKNYP